jgi:hypothetical protein
MLGIDGLVTAAFFAVLWVLVAWAVYWLIRLAVRHGTLDAMRQDRSEEERRHARRSLPRSPSHPE